MASYTPTGKTRLSEKRRFGDRIIFMKNFAELLQAIASLLWPILCISIAIYYRKEVKTLLQRLRRGKFLGQEVELEESLARLDNDARQVELERPIVPIFTKKVEQLADPDASSSKLIPLGTIQSFSEMRVQEILDTSKSSPKIALRMLADLIDNELREIIFSKGEVDKPYTFSPRFSREMLARRDVLSPQILQALEEFHSVLAMITHHLDKVSDVKALRALDSGLKIYITLREVPRGIIIVEHPNVTLYSDPECAIKREGVWGVILAMGEKSKGPEVYYIYPTTQTYYQKGMQVAWEWSSRNKWDSTWYRDPVTDLVKLAWSGAMEFVGRHIFST